MHPIRFLWAAALATLLAGLPVARAADAAEAAAEIQLQRTLDAPIELTLDKMELSKAFEAIAARARIPLQIDPACYEALPYGASTRVTATFRAAPVRAALQQVLAPLALEQAVSGATVVIRPTRPLMHIGRTAEWEELALLGQLRETQLTKLEADWTPALRTLLKKPELTVQVADTTNHAKALAQVQTLLPCSVDRALDAYALATGQIWTVHGQNVLILPVKKWMTRQLERPVVLHFTNAPLAEVVAEIAHVSHVVLQPDPGLYLAVPTVTLNSNNGTLQQTLDALAGATGIAWELRDESIGLKVPTRPTPAAPAASGAIVGRVVVPTGKDNLTFDLFVRESDLPPELNEMRKRRIGEAVEALQKSLSPAPATPATPAVPAAPAAPATSAAPAPTSATAPATAPAGR